jgi:hypothetical protein
MKILIEEYQYDAALVRDVLYGIDALQNVEGKVSLSYVGYFYNPKLNDTVFILPKVLMDESGKVFGNKTPESLIHPHTSGLNDQERAFLYEFAVWIYRAVDVYQHSHPESDIVYHRKLSQVGRGMRKRTNTLLDILLSLIQFNKDNRSYITFVLKNIHSGYNKINWTRTISHSQAIVQDDSPIYLNPVNKKRKVNLDEELLIIYYSILNYISDTYGFHVDIMMGFPLIKGAQFENYLNGRGVVRLRQIKYKYFSDKSLELWNLCYAFFAHSTEITTSTELKEYLLVKNFYVVFEAIIDELIGDSKDELPPDFKEQKDGKLVDHLYTYPGLIEADEEQRTYYIGDSKYYKIGGQLGDTSIYKQYTYARNIVQYNIDLWMDDNVPNPEVRLRDDVTEGYNVIPNFFISAAMKEGDYSYNHDEVTPTKISGKNSTEIKFQFRDRLFDRDTMLLSRYNVNFLFVVALYARNRQTEKDEWKKKVRKQFREQIREVLAKQYGFYAITAREGVDDVQQLQGNFHQLIGKVFAPFKEGDDGQRYYSLALEKEESCAEENERVMELLKPLFHIVECPMGTDPQEVLPKVEQKRVTVREDEAESSGKGPYLLSSVDKNVNADITEIAEGKASSFISGYSMLLAGIDFRQIKYFAAVIDHLVAGYYRVESYDVFNATEILEEAKKTGSKQYQGYDKPYRVKLVLGDYTPLEAPFTYGIDRNASKGVAMPAKVFKEYCKKGVQTSQ